MIPTGVKASKPYTELIVRLPKPHLRQQQFIDSPAKRRVVRAGRRGGKTVGVAILSVKAFLAGRRVLYATPTSDQFQRYWELVKSIMNEAIRNGAYYKNENLHTIQQHGSDARIKAKTAWNADTLRGDYADLLIFDEYQLMNEDAWGVVGAPMLLDNGGDAIFIYTPPSVRTAGSSKARDKRHASKLFKRAQEDKTGRWATFHFSSHENPHLDRVALEEIAHDMGTIEYRQEILAEDLDEIPGALWNRALLDDTRVLELPDDMIQIVVGVDPKVTEKRGESETGIIVAGIDRRGHIYIIADYSTNAGPDAWAKVVVDAYTKHEANRIVAEVNQGGDLVKSVIRQYSRTIPITNVRATRSKFTRAEPIATLWEQGKGHIYKDMFQLEEQLVTFLPGDARSPDRLDAMVWACTSLSKIKSNVRNASSAYDWTNAINSQRAGV